MRWSERTREKFAKKRDLIAYSRISGRGGMAKQRTTINRLLAFTVVVDEGSFQKGDRMLGQQSGGSEENDRAWRVCRQLAQDIYGSETEVKLLETIPAGAGVQGHKRLRLTKEGAA